MSEPGFFYHNPLSYICGECGEVVEGLVEIGRQGTERIPPKFRVRCHTKTCSRVGKWYQIDRVELQLTGVEDVR